jgi:serine/threonine protein kinase
MSADIMLCTGVNFKQQSTVQVYKVLGPNKNTFAIKRVDLSRVKDNSQRSGFLDEADMLKKLSGKQGIIRCIDVAYNPDTQVLYEVLEMGETDVASAIASRRKLLGEHDLYKTHPMYVGTLWSEMVCAVKVGA